MTSRTSTRKRKRNEQDHSEQTVTSGMVAALVPAVTQGVVQALRDMGVIPAALPSAPEAEHLEPRVTVEPTPGPSSAKGTTSGISKPLTLGIDPKIKGQIWASQYVDFEHLIGKDQPANVADRFELVPGENGLLVCKQPRKTSIRSMEQWLQAFHIFMAIYCEKFHSETGNLLKYASIIQTLGKQAGELAAFKYDKNFRQWREEEPAALRFETINVELYNMALAQGLCAKAKGPFQPAKGQSGGSGSKRHCFRFNNSDGQCNRAKCPFSHTCQRCNGEHC